jgi:hypothetical protein
MRMAGRIVERYLSDATDHGSFVAVHLLTAWQKMYAECCKPSMGEVPDSRDPRSFSALGKVDDGLLDSTCHTHLTCRFGSVSSGDHLERLEDSPGEIPR